MAECFCGCGRKVPFLHRGFNRTARNIQNELAELEAIPRDLYVGFPYLDPSSEQEQGRRHVETIKEGIHYREWNGLPSSDALNYWFKNSRRKRRDLANKQAKQERRARMDAEHQASRAASDVPLARDLPFGVYDDGRTAALAEASAATTLEDEYVALSVAHHLLRLQMDVMGDTLVVAEEAMQTHPRSDVQEFRDWIDGWTKRVEGRDLQAADRLNAVVRELGRDECQELLSSIVIPRVEALRVEAGTKIEQFEAKLGGSDAPHPDSYQAELERLEAAKPSRPARPPIPEAVRHSVWRRDEGRCVECNSNRNLELDHIIPFSEGGSNTERNLQLLCESCNRRKGARI